MRTIIRPDIVESPYMDSGISTLRIKEIDSGAKLKKLLVRGAPLSSYVVALDGVMLAGGRCSHRIRQFSLHLDASVPRINRVCDALVVHADDAAVRVALIDLKSEAPSIPDALLQLHSSALFLTYLSSILAWHSNVAEVPLVMSKRVVMLGASKVSVGGVRPAMKVRSGVGVVAVSADKFGVAKLPFVDLFD